MKKLCRNLKIVSMLVCIALLTGCVGQIGNVVINPDGSAEFTVSVGYTKEALDMAYETDMENGGEGYNLEQFTAFEYNGITYYGDVATESISSLEELNAYFNGEDAREGGEGISTICVEGCEDGTFLLRVTATKDMAGVEQTKTDVKSEAEIDQETLDELFKDMAVVLQLTFPGSVVQVAGGTDGVSVEDSKLTLDLVKMGESIGENETMVYEFKAQGYSGKIKFYDVEENDWYYNAVYALADAGLVKGMGSGLFAPEHTLTYAQFCQILAQAESMPTGALDGYWAGNAIKSCRNMEYIIDLGEYTPENYDVPIPREAAVAAMARAKAEAMMEDSQIKETDIPDFDLIGEEYKEDIISAYNCGITFGIDTNRTFNPKGNLTRAEVCQLFYNSGWVN